MASNKIKYGLSELYYAVAVIDTDGSATYSTPVAFPGAVSLSLDPEGDRTPFYADNIEYWVGNANTGYSGSLEVARVTDSFKQDILGFVLDDNNVLFEDQNTEAVHFALIFQFEGDQKKTKHVMYNCTAGRPASSGSTKSESVEPETETIDISVASIYEPTMKRYIVKAETTPDTSDADIAGFVTDVYIPEVTP